MPCFAGQQVECSALPKQMEAAGTPLQCDLMGSDVCMCVLVQCCNFGLDKYSIQVLLLGNNEILLKWNTLQGFILETKRKRANLYNRSKIQKRLM